MNPPLPAEVRAAREVAGHTQTEAAAVLYMARGAWARWESGERRMEPALLELYKIKTGQLRASLVTAGCTASSRPA